MNYEHDEEWEWGSFISKDGHVTGLPPTPLTMMGGIAGLIVDILPSLPEGSLSRAKANAALKALGFLSKGQLHISEGGVVWGECQSSFGPNAARAETLRTMYEEFATPPR